ncbi:neprilysin-3-like [Ornithodoros turicata]|uniref:neprilysin-3-like n=1 Tax=Ornithodoros turicata TaxID=34597 RepID=UPI003138B1E0
MRTRRTPKTTPSTDTTEATEAETEPETPTPTKKRIACERFECVVAGGLISRMRNLDLNPCDNFYSYLCAKKVTKTAKKTTAFDVFQDPSFKKLERDLSAVGKVYRAYKQCVQAGATQAAAINEVKNMLEQIGLPDWPSWPPLDSAPGLGNVLLLMANAMGLINVLNLFPHRGVLNIELKMDTTLFPSDDKVDDYKKRIVRGMQIFRGPQSSINESDLNTAAEDIYKFEKNLIAITQVKTDSQDFDKTTTISQLMTEIPQFPWLIFFQALHKKITARDEKYIKFDGITDQTLVTVRNFNHFATGVQVLGSFRNGPSANFLGWYAVSQTWNIMTSPENPDNVKDPEAKEKFCFNFLNKTANEVVAKIYVQSSISDKAQARLLQLRMSILDSFQTMLNGQLWMKPEMKAYATSRLDRAVLMLGYPDWFMDNKTLDATLEFVEEYQKDTPVVAILNSFRRNHFLKTLKSVGYTTERTPWVGDIDAVNAFYDSIRDIAFVPAGVLQTPYYGEHLPQAFVMGALGSLVGRELGMAFTKPAFQNSIDGSYTRVNLQQQKELDDKMECFRGMYGSASSSNMHTPQAERELAMHIADNAGLDVAYWAYQETTAGIEEKVLSLAEDLSDAELFFAAYGMMSCLNSVDEKRMNVALGNMPSFLQAFNCTETAKMKIQNGCPLWRRDASRQKL